MISDATTTTQRFGASSLKCEKCSLKPIKRRKQRLLTNIDFNADDGEFLSVSATKRKLGTAEDNISAEVEGSTILASKRRTRFSTEVHPLHDFIFNSVMNAMRDEEPQPQLELQPDIECKLLRMSLSNKSSRIRPDDEGDSAFEDAANKVVPDNSS
mmetsp:Transcript_28930/g.57754  ORF Transcript_28930/g.57754 Transcript_28930/m.57754 type:complete len:156 (+) Transcript_28930:177-644(+)|eukprot:CAMPEP_0171335786 /NCGR_PEP_ID=MMETSP0878-20121228/5566_1 /TAXON_ID=67004 /ORGANISM="Thalassiosira weissflogii, Strain CCMP1336" /LENGTH=155 /DNA_ID=CAMNT_0011837103 /DNA_START=57 /DNA_END=524 /DNA_ORIENTATION=-